MHLDYAAGWCSIAWCSIARLRRREFLGLAGASAVCGFAGTAAIQTAGERESIPEYLARTLGRFDLARYSQILGAANEYKEGDEAVGVAAPDAASRAAARSLLSNTRISYLIEHSVYEDSLSVYIRRAVDEKLAAKLSTWTMAELAHFLLSQPEADIQRILPGLASDVIACVVKLMSNAELIAVSRKIFHTLPGSRIGAKGYM
ncbi:MAG: ethanolamine ammonia-lyase subunit EutB, partial [Bryobacteraceae bacterium]